MRSRRMSAKLLKFLRRRSVLGFDKQSVRYLHEIPFLDLYEKTSGESLPMEQVPVLKKKHPNIDCLSKDRLHCTLKILGKFGITPLEAIKDPHVFCMNPITMDNYGEILRECGFIKIIPTYIIRYHTLIRSRTIAKLKKEGLIRHDASIEEVIQEHFRDWPMNCRSLQNFPESETSILMVRMNVLERYLNWRLHVTTEEFKKYCRNYMPLKHKPMSDIQEALDLAQNELQFDAEGIRRNGFIISSDPINTKLILENVTSLAGLDIREVIKIEPAILKNNYNALLQIKKLLEEYEITNEAQRRCFRIYCMCPETVQKRLDELRSLKEYQVLSTNPRMLSMIVHKRKMISRLNKIREVKKNCYSLNHLVSSSKVFNNYISSFGNKVCGRDIAVLISSSLQLDRSNDSMYSESEPVKKVMKQLKRHKYWLHAALDVINQNIQFLKERFENEVILNNCQLLLYPIMEIEYYLENLEKIRKNQHKVHQNAELDTNYNNLKCSTFTDSQVLSLVLYEIEKKYHFSGDGIWVKQDGVKIDTRC